MIFSWDLETDPIERAKLAPAPVCASWQQTGQPKASLATIDDFRDTFERALISSRIMIGVNTAYDMAVAGEYWPDLLEAIWSKYRRGQVEDVSLRQKLIDIASIGSTQEVSLEALCARWNLPCPDKDGPWRLEFAALRGVPVEAYPQGAVDYVLGDAERPLQIYALQEAYAQEWQAKSGHPLLHLSAYEARKAFGLHLISCQGIHTDPERTEAFRKRLGRLLGHAGYWLKKASLVRANGSRDTKAAKAMALAKVPPERIHRTDSGDVSLNKDACQEYGIGLLELYSMYSQADTLRSRADDLAQGYTLPLQTRFDTLLETGRTSTSKPKPPLVGVQAQNFPRKAGARECLMPRPGFCFVSVDLPTAELRSLAQTCLDLFGQSSMADQLNAGRDLHLWFGSQILGLEYEAAVALFEAGDKKVKSARQAAKPCNFGFPGGMGIANFVAYAYYTYRVKLQESEAQRLKGIWLAAFPEMAAYFSYVDHQIMKGRDRGIMRHPGSGRWRGRVTYCGACNSHFQERTATAAGDCVAEAQYRCYSAKGSALYGSRTLMFTHDEIVLESPLTMGHDAGMELSAIMADRFTEWHKDVPVLKCTGPTSDPRVCKPVMSMTYSKDMATVWAGDRLAMWSAE